ncbi:MAG: permease [Candidatus Omnitrophota bacterium]
MIIDPICGMQVNPQSSVKVTKEGVDYFFCSTHCRDRFIQQEGIKDTAACCAPARQPFYKHKLFILTIVVGGLLAASLFFPSLEPFRKAFLLYLKSIWWAVLLGLFLGGVIDYYIPREYISKVLARKSPKTILNAVLLGFLMSACSHGILALAIQIHKKGASNPAIVSFLLASPWANPAITIMLISLFGLKGVLIIIAAIVIAINTGFIFIFLEHKGLIEKNKNIVSVAGEFSIIKDIKVRAKHYRFSVDTLVIDGKGVLAGARALADMVLWWILLGVFISSLAGAYIPTHFFHRFMGPTVVGLLVTLALATVIEVCSEGSSPLAFEIYRQTGALGNSFVFLMAGVATDYTEIGLLWSNVGRRVALWLPAIAVPQIIVVGYMMNRMFK